MSASTRKAGLDAHRSGPQAERKANILKQASVLPGSGIQVVNGARSRLVGAKRQDAPVFSDQVVLARLF